MNKVTTTLPCGCHIMTDIVDGRQVMYYEPCSMDCEYFKYAQDTAKELNKPTTTIDMR